MESPPILNKDKDSKIQGDGVERSGLMVDLDDKQLWAFSQLHPSRCSLK